MNGIRIGFDEDIIDNGALLVGRFFSDITKDHDTDRKRTIIYGSDTMIKCDLPI